MVRKYMKIIVTDASRTLPIALWKVESYTLCRLVILYSSVPRHETPLISATQMKYVQSFNLQHCCILHHHHIITFHAITETTSPPPLTYFLRHGLWEDTVPLGKKKPNFLCTEARIICWKSNSQIWIRNSVWNRLFLSTHIFHY